ncbi:hypothetical protein GDO81_023448 [Engystomops pustulosus]|uniref:Fibronectin type-III domain-containing protein n=1 Tax=Engystomops pustulosus TaxID=76066 RepID=A0AAV6ZHL7_ENGPU|nr:hypothetical protein GDO81_023448 [Engystomops pustulosus]
MLYFADLILLSGDIGVPHCFSRQLETVVCYWAAEELQGGDGGGVGDVSYSFYYAYDREAEEECEITVQAGLRTFYVCEHDDVILFNDLNVYVRDKATNRLLRSRKLELELFVIIPGPYNLHVVWEEDSDRFRVTWKPPELDVSFMFKYEVQFWSHEEERQSVVVRDVKEVLLPQLKPFLLYHVRVRTSWDGEKPSIWGPWSEEVTLTSVASAETIGFRCFTSDLAQVCCRWEEEVLDASYLEVHYKYGQDSASTWRPCQYSAQHKDCHCVFPARNDSSTSVKLNVTSVVGKCGLYYNSPFWINHIVKPPAPELHVHQLPGNTLALNWSSPMPGIRTQLIYQIRFSTDKGKSWTTVQVPSGAHAKEISMVSDKTYILQIRAGPDQEEIQGFWSEWSARVTTKSSSSSVWVVPVVIASFLIVLAAGLLLPYIFPSFYRKLKDKLWPPLPNLHRVLDTFLAEIQKQYQPNSTLYEKPQEEAAQTSCLEILSEVTTTSDRQHVSRDYVQLAPPSYQNEEYWPNLEPLELSPGISAHSPLPGGLTNQTYLPTGWSMG